MGALRIYFSMQAWGDIRSCAGLTGAEKLPSVDERGDAVPQHHLRRCWAAPISASTTGPPPQRLPPRSTSSPPLVRSCGDWREVPAAAACDAAEKVSSHVGRHGFGGSDVNGGRRVRRWRGPLAPVWTAWTGRRLEAADGGDGGGCDRAAAWTAARRWVEESRRGDGARRRRHGRTGDVAVATAIGRIFLSSFASVE